MRALWAPGTKAYAGERVTLPETTGYPRPAGRIPVIVGGNGERRTLAIAARLGDGCNLPSAFEVLDHKLAVLRSHLDAIGRPTTTSRSPCSTCRWSGRDRDDVWARVERLRGRTDAAAYAEPQHAGTVAQQRDRWAGLAERGVRTVFVSTPDLDGPEDVLALPRPDGLTYFSSALVRPSTRRATISCWICWVPSKMSRILESRAHFSSSSLSL